MKKLTQTLAVLGIIATTLAGCQNLTDYNWFSWGQSAYTEDSQSAANDTEPAPHSCHPRGAYSAGLQDGQHHRRMNADFAAACPNDREDINLSYRRGYENGERMRYTDNRDSSAQQTGRDNYPRDMNPPKEKTKLKPYDPTSWRCFPDASGNKVCGYYCERADGKVQCADSKSKRCVKNDRGEIACGYNCVSTAKTVKCSYAPDVKCLSDAFGNVQCGDHCYRHEGNVICE